MFGSCCYGSGSAKGVNGGDMRYKYFCLAWLLAVMMTGCALFRPDIEPPKVVLDSLEMLPVNGLNQHFKIGLRMINPNDRALNIRGINYTLALNGYKLIDGVSSDIPEVPAFSEVAFDVQASTNMFEALRFINNFMGGKASGDLNYRLHADISIAGLPRRVSVEETGTVPLFTPKD